MNYNHNYVVVHYFLVISVLVTLHGMMKVNKKACRKLDTYVATGVCSQKSLDAQSS